jgi:beta-glucosidase
MDGDGIIAQEDLYAFLDCLAGPGVPVSGECAAADLDDDGDVDLQDYGDWSLNWLSADCRITATATSQEGAGPLYHPFNAIDGLSSTRWSSDFVDDQTLSLDFGHRRPVDAITIEWEVAYASAYTVLASIDGEDWTTVFSTTTGDGGVDTITTPGLIARYINIHCQTRATPYGSSIWEVRFESPVRCYADPRPIDERVDELVSMMTLEEKVSLLYGETVFSLRAIPRLRVPALQLADGPLGIRWGTATAFPASIALASTWDLDLADRFGAAIAREFRNKARQVWLGPGFNLIRIPQNGRTFEYFSEDPFLASRLAVSTIRAAQSSGVVACAKHFVANNQEQDRFTVDVQMDERTLRELYLPAFEAAVTEGGVRSVMAAYNRLDGLYCTANERLLTDILKTEWGFDGFVVSDWGAVHETVAPALAGLDLEMDGAVPTGAYWGDGQLLSAVQSQQVSVAAIDDKVRRILRGIVSTGIMDAPWESPDEEIVAHRALVREIAAQGTVLLKNENNVLPLNRDESTTIAVLGPNFSVAQTGGGGSSRVNPYYSVSPLEGLQNVGGPGITFDAVVGVPTSEEFVAAPADWLTPLGGGADGLLGQYFNNRSLSGPPVVTRVDGPVEFYWGGGSPDPAVASDNFSARWAGQLTVPVSGVWDVGMATDDGFRLYVEGELVIDDWRDHALELTTAPLALTAGEPVDITLEYYEAGGEATAVFVCQQSELSEAIDAAAGADAALIFVGLDASHESEGFDRPSIDLTPGEIQLIEAVAAVQPDTVVVIVAGSQVGFDDWMDDVPAIVQAWYGGQEAGNAIADVLFGDVNPSGRLPMTFVRRLEDHPTFGLYPSGVYSDGLAVGYRYFDTAAVAPAYPFGHGLSYTTFSYSDLSIDTSELATEGVVTVSFVVENTGDRAGRETPQVYVRDIAASVTRPYKELKGFAKIDVDAGASVGVSVTLDDRAFAFYDESLPGWRVEPGQFDILVGSSASDIRLTGSFTHP